MSTNVPVAALVVLGVLLAVLGVLGPAIELVIIGLVAIAAGGVIAVLGARRT